MLKIPLSDIISKIREKTGLSEQDVNAKIDAKMAALSGLISKEGAAHIVANELGVKVFEQLSGKLQIKNVISGMRSVETVGKVTRKFELREFNTGTRSGKVSNIVIGDETGTIRLVMWGENAENINKLNEGDIVKVINAYTRENMGKVELHMNDRSQIVVNPPGEKVGAVVQAMQQAAAQRKQLKELAEGMENVEIFGTITQTFDPRFFTVCPECNKKVNQEGDRFVCAAHNAVVPKYSYVLNCILDDGTENLRCVFFKNQAERLLNKTEEQILPYKDNPSDFETVKTDLLGNQIKLVGRVNKNAMFDRLEFVTQLVFTNPNPEEEIKRLQDL